jgi:hypothetical protein
MFAELVIFPGCHSSINYDEEWEPLSRINRSARHFSNKIVESYDGAQLHEWEISCFCYFDDNLPKDNVLFLDFGIVNFKRPMIVLKRHYPLNKYIVDIMTTKLTQNNVAEFLTEHLTPKRT